MKLFEKSINDLRRALVTEKAAISTIKPQIKELRKLLNEEKVQRDELKGF